MRYTKAQIGEAFIIVRRMMHGAKPRAHEIIQVLQPYHDCTEIGDINSALHESTRSMIFALTADAYRIEGDAQQAAEWYRKASSIYSGGHAELYAHLVCKHKLSEFYSDALRTLQENQCRWKARSLTNRIYFSIRL
jgi:hypothetical protein